MHAILNEIVFGGQVLETSSDEVMRVVEEITRSIHSLSIHSGKELCICTHLSDIIPSFLSIFYAYRLEKTSTNPISFVPKSVSGRFGR